MGACGGGAPGSAVAARGHPLFSQHKGRQQLPAALKRKSRLPPGGPAPPALVPALPSPRPSLPLAPPAPATRLLCCSFSSPGTVLPRDPYIRSFSLLDVVPPAPPCLESVIPVARRDFLNIKPRPLHPLFLRTPVMRAEAVSSPRGALCARFSLQLFLGPVSAAPHSPGGCSSQTEGGVTVTQALPPGLAQLQRSPSSHYTDNITPCTPPLLGPRDALFPEQSPHFSRHRCTTPTARSPSSSSVG